MTVISWAVFDQPPDGRTISGTAVIIAAGLYIWLRERRLRRPVSPLGDQKTVV